MHWSRAFLGWARNLRATAGGCERIDGAHRNLGRDPAAIRFASRVDPRGTRFYAARMLPRAIRILSVLALVAAALPAQSGKQKKSAKSKAQEPAPAARPGPEKDDATTKKDKAVAALDAFLAAHAPNTKQDGWRTQMSEPPVQAFAEDRDYFWHLATNRGEMKIRLLPQVAPMHCTSAIYLTRAGFYDGLAFHRVIKGFMAQGGCPNGTGSGNAGFTMKGETSDAVKHDKAGLISTANEDGKEKTDGSQFFLTFAPCPHLDGKHTIFGEVVEGMETVTAMDALGGEGESQKPAEPISIVRAWVVVVPKDGAAPAEAEDAKGDSKAKKPASDKKAKKPAGDAKKQAS